MKCRCNCRRDPGRRWVAADASCCCQASRLARPWPACVSISRRRTRHPRAGSSGSREIRWTRCGWRCRAGAAAAVIFSIRPATRACFPADSWCPCPLTGRATSRWCCMPAPGRRWRCVRASCARSRRCSSGGAESRWKARSTPDSSCWRSCRWRCTRRHATAPSSPCSPARARRCCCSRRKTATSTSCRASRCCRRGTRRACGRSDCCSRRVRCRCCCATSVCAVAWTRGAGWIVSASCWWRWRRCA